MLGRRCLRWPGCPRHANGGTGGELLRASGPHPAWQAALQATGRRVIRLRRIRKRARSHGTGLHRAGLHCAGGHRVGLRGVRWHRVGLRVPVAAGQASALREALPGRQPLGSRKATQSGLSQARLVGRVRRQRALRPARPRCHRPGEGQRRGHLQVQLGRVAQRRVLLLALGGHRDEAVREHDDRLGAPVRGGDELDLDGVPGREPAGDEEAEPVGVREVEVRRARELLVDLPQLVRSDAQAPVLDLDGEAVGHPLGPDLHAGGGGREQGRVLDQFGEQVDQVGDRRRGDRLLGISGDGDPLVVLNLRDRRPDHVDHRDRGAPGANGRRARHDGQGLGVAAHPGREVVQREQVRELAGTDRLLLQVVDDLQLPVQQGLIPAAQAHEDLPQAVAQPGLADGRLERGPLDGADGRGSGGDLGRLGELGARPQRIGLQHPARGRVRRRRRLALAQVPDHPGKFLVGDGQGRMGQVRDLPRQAAGVRRHEQDGEERDEGRGPGQGGGFGQRLLLGRA